MIRVLIADDHPIVRDGLRRLLADHADMALAGEAVDGDELLRKLSVTAADVVLVDVAMPGPGFLEILRVLREQHPTVRVVVLSAYHEEQYALRALRAGASGYLTKDRTPEELVEALRRVHRGSRYVTQSLGERLAAELAGAHTGPAHEALSDREFEVFRLIGSGLGVKEIAARLGLSAKTVSTYRSRILEKLHFTTTAELIRYAIEHQVTEPRAERT